MPVLRRLRAAGFSIWPFDPSGWPRIVEIYPRLLTRSVEKSDRGAREEYLACHYPNLPSHMHACAVKSEDAFDAAVSARVMDRHINSLLALAQAADDVTLLEGTIWNP
jgi:hypothetical protein